MSLENSYIPDIIPEDDLEYFKKAGYGNRIGWGKSAAILIVDMTDEQDDMVHHYVLERQKEELQEKRTKF